MIYKITIEDAKFLVKNAEKLTDEKGRVSYKIDSFYRLVDVSIDFYTVSGKLTDGLKKTPRDYRSFYDVAMSKTAEKILGF